VEGVEGLAGFSWLGEYIVALERRWEKASTPSTRTRHLSPFDAV